MIGRALPPEHRRPTMSAAEGAPAVGARSLMAARDPELPSAVVADRTNIRQLSSPSPEVGKAIKARRGNDVSASPETTGSSVGMFSRPHAASEMFARSDSGH